MKERILQAKAKGDSVGGIVQCTVKGFKGGIGGPMWDGIESKISSHKRKGDNTGSCIRKGIGDHYDETND